MKKICKKLPSLIALLSFLPFKVEALQMKYEPTYSYGVIGGIAYNSPTAEKNGFISNGFDDKKSGKVFISGGVFYEKRFAEQMIGLNMEAAYTNKSYDSESKITSAVRNKILHCADVALYFCFLPKGYGGWTFYGGPKVAFIIYSSDEIDGKEEKVSSDNKRANLPYFGGCLGLRYEVDRVGILIGGDGNYLFQANNSDKFNSQKGIKIYIGYDFGRLHSDYY